ncbi:hypothetical protein AVEN_152770-1, partial [Araneus ventricosus]
HRITGDEACLPHFNKQACVDGIVMLPISCEEKKSKLAHHQARSLSLSTSTGRDCVYEVCAEGHNHSCSAIMGNIKGYVKNCKEQRSIVLLYNNAKSHV